MSKLEKAASKLKNSESLKNVGGALGKFAKAGNSIKEAVDKGKEK